MTDRNRPLSALVRRLLPGTVLLTISVGHVAFADNTASLPDWSGHWRIAGSVAALGSEKGIPFAKDTADNAPLKPQYLAEYNALRARAVKQGDPKATDAITDTNTLNCFAGMPRLIATPFSYLFFITPQETFIVIDKAVRQIFTDGRDWPESDAQWPLMMGRSKGHWEGDTLVAETINMHDDMWTDPTPLMLSDKASLTERLRKTDANTIEDQVTIHDPVKFTADWKFTRHYTRLPEDKTEWPDDPELCGGPTDRNPIVNGKVTVKLPQ